MKENKSDPILCDICGIDVFQREEKKFDVIDYDGKVYCSLACMRKRDEK